MYSLYCCVAMHYPSLSTDQIAAFLELAKLGSLRRAAETLHITEQGLRNRLLALEARLGVQLYRKQRGIRRATALTEQGRQFQSAAAAFMQRAHELMDGFGRPVQVQDVHIHASQYLTYYVLIDVVKKFHAAFPNVRIRLSTRTEEQIETALLQDPGVAAGIAAPYESSPSLEYHHLFSMDWSLITPLHHPLLKRRKLSLSHLADQPLILFERGSTGRNHIVDAFRRQGLDPRIEMEMTNTLIMVRMVESGLGISIVPLLANGTVTRGCKIGIRPLGKVIAPIRSGILLRSGETLSAGARQFIRFVEEECRAPTS